MSRKIKYTWRFFDDLNEIFDYISGSFYEELAIRSVNDIYNEINTKLSSDIQYGKTYLDDDFYRYIVVSKRKDIVFYHIKDDTAVVYRIFDQRRNFGALLEEDQHDEAAK
jgi:plasmid stabilization system protein ParE